MPPLSVIVSTSPGREPQLSYCLEALCRQRHVNFEVIVCDDGSTGGRAVVNGFLPRLSLDYQWWPNAGCPSRSRNAGAAASRHDWLVFIDSDVLLNPGALAAYAHYLPADPSRLLYAYVGCDRDSTAESIFFSDLAVNFWDARFDWTSDGLAPLKRLFHSPYENAYAGNFGLHRQTFASIGGFDERFYGWGGEDLDFGEAAVKRGFEVHFLLDAWAEHQVHTVAQDFHSRPSEQRGHSYVFRPHKAVGYQVQVIYSAPVRQWLEQLIRSHYAAKLKPLRLE
ncbi:MAG: hypothetical protein CVV27_09815 [Candidatus Melainabacteria bacterium HGW-Melainabacteria-1]|nr:MAG: hypothetical protein CVV27_09815 [Candidatus Melainabacteria bacterium HGW-Melainabacteria-1]